MRQPRIKRTLWTAAAAAFVGIFSTAVYGFGDLGHLSVCEIAYQQVTPTTRQQIDRLTAGGVPFPVQCLWPDQVKKLPKWLSTAGYHFVNYEDGAAWEPTDLVRPRDKPPFHAAASGDIIQMLLQAKKKLQSTTASNDQKLCYLRYLGHLAGDSQQPLHSGRASDSGGNAMKVSWNGLTKYPIRSVVIHLQRDAAGNIIEDQCSQQIFRPSLACLTSETLVIKQPDGSMGFVDNNLHTMWDDAFIDYSLKQWGVIDVVDFDNRNILTIYQKYVAKLQERVAGQESVFRRLMDEDILRWVEYSNQYRSFAYDVKGIDKSQYYDDRMSLITQLLARGGYHLAGALNQIFDPSYQSNPLLNEFATKREHELEARIKAGRQTEFKTVCDSL